MKWNIDLPLYINTILSNLHKTESLSSNYQRS